MLTWLGRFKGWIASATGALAAIVLVVTNLDKLASTLAGWLGPYLKPSATIEVIVDQSTKVPLLLAIKDGPKILNTQSVQAGSSVAFIVPANVEYTVVWQGMGIKPESAPNILAPPQTIRWRLAVRKSQEGVSELALRMEGETKDRGTEEPTATVLASVAAAQSANDPASRPPSSNLFPEFERAAFVIGLLETGTTDCHASVFVQPNLISVGCFGFSIPGWLGELLARLVNELPDEVTAAVGGDFVALIKNSPEASMSAVQQFLSDQARRDQFRAGLRQIVQWPAFRHHYEAKVLDAYGEAMRLARQIGLRSERGVLLMFDNMVFLGPGRARALAAGYAKQPAPEGTPSEPEKIKRYADFVIGQAPPGQRPIVQRRAGLMVGGKASSRGVRYDLNELGIRDDVDMLATRQPAQ